MLFTLLASSHGVVQFSILYTLTVDSSRCGLERSSFLLTPCRESDGSCHDKIPNVFVSEDCKVYVLENGCIFSKNF